MQAPVRRRVPVRARGPSFSVLLQLLLLYPFLLLMDQFARDSARSGSGGFLPVAEAAFEKLGQPGLYDVGVGSVRAPIQQAVFDAELSSFWPGTPGFSSLGQDAAFRKWVNEEKLVAMINADTDLRLKRQTEGRQLLFLALYYGGFDDVRKALSDQGIFFYDYGSSLGDSQRKAILNDGNAVARFIDEALMEGLLPKLKLAPVSAHDDVVTDWLKKFCMDQFLPFLKSPVSIAVIRRWALTQGLLKLVQALDAAGVPALTTLPLPEGKTLAQAFLEVTSSFDDANRRNQLNSFIVRQTLGDFSIPELVKKAAAGPEGIPLDMALKLFRYVTHGLSGFPLETWYSAEKILTFFDGSGVFDILKFCHSDRAIAEYTLPHALRYISLISRAGASNAEVEAAFEKFFVRDLFRTAGPYISVDVCSLDTFYTIAARNELQDEWFPLLDDPSGKFSDDHQKIIIRDLFIASQEGKVGAVQPLLTRLDYASIDKHLATYALVSLVESVVSWVDSPEFVSIFDPEKFASYYKPLILHMVDLGANVNAQIHSDGPVLHMLALLSNTASAASLNSLLIEPMIELLIELGADPALIYKEQSAFSLSEDIVERALRRQSLSPTLIETSISGRAPYASWVVPVDGLILLVSFVFWMKQRLAKKDALASSSSLFIRIPSRLVGGVVGQVFLMAGANFYANGLFVVDLRHPLHPYPFMTSMVKGTFNLAVAVLSVVFSAEAVFNSLYDRQLKLFARENLPMVQEKFPGVNLWRVSSHNTCFDVRYERDLTPDEQSSFRAGDTLRISAYYKSRIKLGLGFDCVVEKDRLCFIFSSVAFSALRGMAPMADMYKAPTYDTRTAAERGQAERDQARQVQEEADRLERDRARDRSAFASQKILERVQKISAELSKTLGAVNVVVNAVKERFTLKDLTGKTVNGSQLLAVLEQEMLELSLVIQLSCDPNFKRDEKISDETWGRVLEKKKKELSTLEAVEERLLGNKIKGVAGLKEEAKSFCHDLVRRWLDNNPDVLFDLSAFKVLVYPDGNLEDPAAYALKTTRIDTHNRKVENKIAKRRAEAVEKADAFEAQVTRLTKLATDVHHEVRRGTGYFHLTPPLKVLYAAEIGLADKESYDVAEAEMVLAYCVRTVLKIRQEVARQFSADDLTDFKRGWLVGRILADFNAVSKLHEEVLDTYETSFKNYLGYVRQLQDVLAVEPIDAERAHQLWFPICGLKAHLGDLGEVYEEEFLDLRERMKLVAVPVAPSIAPVEAGAPVVPVAAPEGLLLTLFNELDVLYKASEGDRSESMRASLHFCLLRWFEALARDVNKATVSDRRHQLAHPVVEFDFERLSNIAKMIVATHGDKKSFGRMFASNDFKSYFTISSTLQYKSLLKSLAQGAEAIFALKSAWARAKSGCSREDFARDHLSLIAAAGYAVIFWVSVFQGDQGDVTRNDVSAVDLLRIEFMEKFSEIIVSFRGLRNVLAHEPERSWLEIMNRILFLPGQKLRVLTDLMTAKIEGSPLAAAGSGALPASSPRSSDGAFVVGSVPQAVVLAKAGALDSPRRASLTSAGAFAPWSVAVALGSNTALSVAYQAPGT